MLILWVASVDMCVHRSRPCAALKTRNESITGWYDATVAQTGPYLCTLALRGEGIGSVERERDP